MNDTPGHAELHWDENGQPLSTQFDDVYFSKASGLEETRYVFLQHNDLPQRWQALQPGETFTIGETGFGTGLNFLTCWQAWQQHAPAGARLHFVSVEKYPLTQGDLEKALALWPELAPLAATLQNHYALTGPGYYRWHLAADVTLSLLIDDAISAFESLLPVANPGPAMQALDTNLSGITGKTPAVDAWFLDGFAPAKNPGMWQPELFNVMARLSRPGTTFATFTAAGIVRRGLTAVGFEVRKTQGYGHKREMICGHFVAPADQPPVQKPTPSWHTVGASHPAPRHVAVIGAGLAGAHTAWRLAQAGLQVTVLERGDIASGGSGNAQGALYTRLSAGGALAEFNKAAFDYAASSYQAGGVYDHDSNFASCGAQCGLLQVAETPEEEASARQLAASVNPAFARFVEQVEASAIAGVTLNFGGVYFPRSGWLSPPQLCHRLLKHPRISLKTHTEISRLEFGQNQWHLFNAAGETTLHTDAVVIACASAATSYSQCASLPVKAIRGQVSTVKASVGSRKLKTVLCGKGYLPPTVTDGTGTHCLGATFNLKDQSLEPAERDTASNLANANALSPQLAFQPEHVVAERANFRCTTPDYLPIVGPVPDIAAMSERFAPLRRNYKQTMDVPGCYWPGLFINIGHGSRGLTYTPLCAEMLASQITGQLPPLPRQALSSLHPARFLIRNLGRNRA